MKGKSDMQVVSQSPREKQKKLRHNDNSTRTVQKGEYMGKETLVAKEYRGTHVQRVHVQGRLLDRT